MTALFINYQRRFLLFKTITSKNYCQLKAEEKQELEKKFLKEKEFAKSPKYQAVIKHYSKIRKLLFVFAPIKISIHLFALFIGLYGVKNGILKIIKNRPFFNVVDSTLYCIALCLNFSAIIAKSWVKKIDQNYKNKYPNLDVEFKGIKNQFAWSRH